MQSLKDTAANIAASAVSGMEKTKATVQEKVENMTTHDPEQREMARERKEERITQAEIDKQDAKQYRAASSKYGASATGGQGYYSSEATGGCLTSGHDTHTLSATEDTGYPMGAHQTSAMRGHGTGKQYGGQEEEGVVSTYPGGLPGDSTTRRNTRAGGTAFRTGSGGTGQSYGGQVEEGVVNTYPGGLPGDNTTGRHMHAGDGTGYGARPSYGGQVEEDVVSTYPDGLPGGSTTGHHTRADDTEFRTGTDGTGYGTRPLYGGQVEEDVVSTYPDGLPGDSTTGHHTRADDTEFRTGTDGTGYGTRPSYGGQVEEDVVSTYPDGLPGDSTTGHHTSPGDGTTGHHTRADDTEFRTGTDGTGYGTRPSYGGQVEVDVVGTYPDGLPGDSTTGHNTRADDTEFRTGTDGTGYTTGTDSTGYTTGTGTGSNAPDWQL